MNLSGTDRQRRTKPFFAILVSASGVSLAIQAMGLLRQILLVSAFGFSRSLDLFSTLYALLSLSVFSFAVIVESVTTSIMTRISEARGETAMRKAIIPSLLVASTFSVLLVLSVALCFPLISIPFTAGFDAATRSDFETLAWHALPWAVLVVPYTVIGVCLKCNWQYKPVFLAELLVTAVSTLSIYCWHEQIADAVLAYAYGYGVAVLFLLYAIRKVILPSGEEGFPWREFTRRTAQHFLSNQVGVIGSLVERYWFSFLPPGGIAALALVQQITISLASLLSFRDAYLVPLAQAKNRGQKLSRLLIGLGLLAMMASAAIMALADPICTVLFHYGKVAMRDTSLVADLLRIGGVTVAFSIVATPIWRLQQMSGVYRPLTIVYFVVALVTFALGYLLIATMQSGAPGMALIAAINAFWACGVAMMYAKGFGARIEASEWRLIAVSVLIFSSAAGIAFLVVGAVDVALLGLVSGALCFVVFVAICAFPFRGRIRQIVLGPRSG